MESSSSDNKDSGVEVGKVKLDPKNFIISGKQKEVTTDPAKIKSSRREILVC